jgi:hypothetical protein
MSGFDLYASITLIILTILYCGIATLIVAISLWRGR